MKCAVEMDSVAVVSCRLLLAFKKYGLPQQSERL
jgi:hypothetical protein